MICFSRLANCDIIVWPDMYKAYLHGLWYPSTFMFIDYCNTTWCVFKVPSSMHYLRVWSGACLSEPILVLSLGLLVWYFTDIRYTFQDCFFMVKKCDFGGRSFQIPFTHLKSNIDTQQSHVWSRRCIFQGPSFLVSMVDFGGVIITLPNKAIGLHSSYQQEETRRVMRWYPSNEKNMVQWNMWC